MPTNTLVFNVEDRRARAAFSRLKREVDQLEDEFNTTRSEARAAGEAIDRLGDQSRTSAENVERLGNEAKTTTTQLDGLGITARRNNATWRDTNGRLRDARGRFIGAGQGAEFFTRSLSGARGLLTGLGAALAAREIFEFGAASVRSAGQMEGLLRGLRAIEGSQADSRLRDFNEIAKLPGLNTPQIIRYSNSLRAAGATASEVDAIITTFGQAIVGLGGNAADTSRAMLQLTQAFGENKISQENFSTIKELIPNFNKLAQEVYNTDGTMDGLNKTFQASGQTLGQFLLPILAKLRQEIPTAPVDSYARSVDALQEEFNQLQIAIGDKLLPVVSKASRGFAEFFDNITNFIQGTNDAKASVEAYTTALSTATAAGTVNKAFQDRIAFLQQEKAALEAAAEGNVNYFRVRGRETDAGSRYKEITAELDRLQVSAGNAASQSEYLRTEQVRLTTQAQALSAEIDQLNTKLRGRTPRTNPGEFARRREARAELTALQTQIATNANALRALASVNTITAKTVETATTNTENFDLALAKLKATAEDARGTLQRTLNFEQVTPNFQAAIAASNAYYNNRIAKAQETLEKETQGTDAYNQLQVQIFELGRQRLQAERQLNTENQRLIQQLTQQRTEQVTPNFQAAINASNAYYNNRIEKAQEALEKETQGTEAYNQLQVQIFELGRQRLQAERQLNTENQRLIQQLTQERMETATAASKSEVEGFKATTDAAKAYTDQLQRQINAIPRLRSPDAQYGGFTSQLRKDFEDAETQGRSLLTVMREIARLSLGPIDLDARIPDPDVRQQQIDAAIAAEARGAQTLNDIRIEAGEQGRRFLNRIRRNEERDIQRSVNERTRTYRQFANLVSNTFVDLATGRTQSFESVATAFVQQSIRIVLRAFVEFQIQKRLDDTLTASKIANINKIAAAQSAAGAGGLGNLAGLGNLSGLGSSLAGGGAALGVSALLFPTEIRNLTGGITDTIGNLLDNVASIPDRAFGAQQFFLKIGDNEAREITDLQADLKNESRV